MKDDIEDIKNTWKAGKKTVPGTDNNADQLIALAKKNKRNTINLHIGTIVILTITLIGISWYFINVTPFKQTLSHIGVALMTGGLAIRIAIEIYSLIRSKQLDLTESALKSSDATIRFYKFRKLTHGPAMIVILVLYTIGFYMLTPEFSLYMSFNMLLFVDLSYLLGAVPVGLSIRNGIRKEMHNLNEILRLRQELME
ncbi:MAG TPA: hypothetical protein PKL31_02025 [Fulvivirga sp.]|nr:hypothetical protein [Fulvivirga sp.]